MHVKCKPSDLKNISVIVPVYNAEAYLRQCLQSIADQTYHALQIIVVDDGSTDGSLRIAQQAAEQDKHIVVLHQSNQGQAAARNTAMRHATGDYIAFVDADDLLEKDYLATLYDAINGYDIVQCGYKRVTDEGRVTESKTPCHKYQFTVPWARLYRSDMLKDVRFPEGMIYEDVAFSLQLWAKHPKYRIIPYTGYNYRLNHTSTTAIADKAAQEKLYAALWEAQAPWWLKTYTYIRLKIHFQR